MSFKVSKTVLIILVQDGNLRKRFVNDTIGGGHINSEGQPPFKKSHMGNCKLVLVICLVCVIFFPTVHGKLKIM